MTRLYSNFCILLPLKPWFMALKGTSKCFYLLGLIGFEKNIFEEQKYLFRNVFFFLHSSAACETRNNEEAIMSPKHEG